MSRIDVARRFYAIFASGEVDQFPEVLTPDWQLKPAQLGAAGDVAGEQQSVTFVHSVIGDVTYDVEDVVEGGDGVVACRNVLRGKLKAPFLGLDLPGAPIELMTMEHHHFEPSGERIAVTWHMEDFYGVEQALIAQGAKRVE